MKVGVRGRGGSPHTICRNAADLEAVNKLYLFIDFDKGRQTFAKFEYDVLLAQVKPGRWSDVKP